ncbi:olfactory receptor 6C3-like [Zonotrichia albicollis]|uniref:olfactory receptor 6C3-like n=1 Tax=Zonotrichia albicollis TaxID=44394 RepID=UPI003D80E377
MARNISYSGCAAQVFLIFFSLTTEIYLLTIMCYDRYVSICKVLYSVVPPALNPLIYSLRNQELKAAVWRLMTGWLEKN